MRLYRQVGLLLGRPTHGFSWQACGVLLDMPSAPVGSGHPFWVPEQRLWASEHRLRPPQHTTTEPVTSRTTPELQHSACGLQSSVCGLQSSACGLQNNACEHQDGACGHQNSAGRFQNNAYGLQNTACGLQKNLVCTRTACKTEPVISRTINASGFQIFERRLWDLQSLGARNCQLDPVRPHRVIWNSFLELRSALLGSSKAAQMCPGASRALEMAARVCPNASEHWEWLLEPAP